MSRVAYFLCAALCARTAFGQGLPQESPKPEDKDLAAPVSAAPRADDTPPLIKGAQTEDTPPLVGDPRREPPPPRPTELGGLPPAPGLNLGESAMLDPTPRRYRGESPQHFAIELKFGPYAPDIDKTPGIMGTPFSDLFGDSGTPIGGRPAWQLLTQVEFDYQFFSRLGTLGVGLSGGYYRISAPQLNYFPTATGSAVCTAVDNGSGGRTYSAPMGIDASGCFSGDSNIFNLVPLELLLIYRFDWLDRRFKIPIVPYVKGGLAYSFWWNGTSGSFVANLQFEKSGSAYSPLANGPAVSGGTAGLAVHPGLALDLGVIDRQAQQIMDRELGVNRISLFCEMNYAWMTNFGVGSKLNLSNLTFSAGLLAEF